MNSPIFLLTYAILWVLVLMQFAALLLLYRQQGRALLNSREGRANQGPELDTPLPTVQMRDLAGNPIHFGQLSTLPRLLSFAQTTCPSCAKALPELAASATARAELLETVLICAGTAQDVTAFAAGLPATVRVVADTRGVGQMRWRISTIPFSIVVDREGIVRSKGMPHDADGFDQLIDQLGDPHPVPRSFVPIESLARKA